MRKLLLILFCLLPYIMQPYIIEAATLDSYSESNYSGNAIALRNGTFTYAAQSFTNTNASTLDSCKFYIKKVGSPTGNVTAYIYEHDGTYGSTSSPGLTPSILATSDVLDIATLTTSYQVIEIEYSGAEEISLTAATYYISAISYTGGDVNNRLVVGLDATTPTHDGNKCKSTDGATWLVDDDEDICFYVEGTPSGRRNPVMIQ